MCLFFDNTFIFCSLLSIVVRMYQAFSRVQKKQLCQLLFSGLSGQSFFSSTTWIAEPKAFRGRPFSSYCVV